METTKDILNLSIPFDVLVELLTGTMSLSVEEGSFLFGRKSGSAAGAAGSGLKEYEAWVKNPDFEKAARIIAAPDFSVVCRVGGGSLPLETIKLHGNKMEGSWIAGISEDREGNCDIRVFESITSFLGWFADTFCGKNEEPAVNHIPPFVSLEEFLFLLHAVDAYRSTAYRNMLAHEYADEPSMEFTDFVESMTVSIKSKDIRWLLPAFLILTPGLSEYPMELTPDKAEILMKLQFAGKLEKPDGGRSRLIFGEAGQNMGVEFYRSWLLAAGFEISVKEKGKLKATERLFIAPTALSNHFVSVVKDEEGKAVVNHQAYTFEELRVKLEAIFDWERFCAACGAPLDSGDAFCGACGAKA